MQIFCSICKDLFIHHSEVVVTECGHLYHNPCVSEWLKNQSTCPQCRASVQKNKVHRVYFDVENDTDIDPSSLQYKIDKLLYDIQLKDGKIKTLNEKVEDLEKNTKLLRELVKNNEHEIQSSKALNNVLRSEVKNSRKEIESLKQNKIEYDLLKDKVTTLTRVEEVINGTVDEVTEMVSNMSVNAVTLRQLCTYVEVLKQQIKRNDAKKEKVVQEAKELQKEVNKLRREKGIVEEQVQALSHANSRLEEELKYFKELSEKHKADDTVSLASPVHKKLKTSLSKFKEKKPEAESNSSVIDLDFDSFHHKAVIPKKSQFSLDKKVINISDVKKKKLSELDDLEIIAGPSKKFVAPLSISNDKGIFKKKEPSLMRSSSFKLPRGSSSNFVFDGMGGSKKVNLATPTPTDEFKQTLLNRDAAKKKTFDRARHSMSALPSNSYKKIDSFFRDF